MAWWLNQNIFENAAVAPVSLPWTVFIENGHRKEQWSTSKTNIGVQGSLMPSGSEDWSGWSSPTGELLLLRFWQKGIVHHNLLNRELRSCTPANVPILTPKHTSGLWRSPLLEGSTTARPKNYWIVDISIFPASASVVSVQLRANLPHIHTKLVPSCKDTAINLQTRCLNYFLG